MIEPCFYLTPCEENEKEISEPKFSKALISSFLQVKEKKLRHFKMFSKNDIIKEDNSR